MDQSPAASSAASLQIADIYYVFFRHKWKIILCTLLGLGAAVTYYELNPPPYGSEAKLFIRYVITEGKSLNPRDDSIKTPDQRGETIINTEADILSSVDLANDVVKSITAKKVLANSGGGTDASKAAALVHRGLVVQAQPWSSVIRLYYENPDLDLVQLVLTETIEAYKKKHVEIHRAVGIVGDFLTQETDQLRARLAQTEEELRKVTNKAGIVSLESSKASFAAQQSRLREEILEAQAKLAERSSIYEQMTKGQPAPAAGDQPAGASASPAQIDAYQKLITRQAQIQQRMLELLTQFTEEAPPVKQLKSLLADAETQRLQLETQFPGLKQIQPVAPVSSNQPPPYDARTENAQINALQARIKILQQQLEQVRVDASNLDQMEISILELRRRKELEESNYRYYAASLEQARINEALGGGRVSNISVVEAPTPAFRSFDKLQKTVGGIALGGLALGLGWALLIEFFLDRTVRRPLDVERTLRLPLFLSIPNVTQDRGPRKWRPRFFKRAKPAPAAPEEKSADPAQLPAPVLPDPAQSLMPGGSELALTPFYETLRDRLITYFDTINLKHKPKLVALTGLGSDSGVTTIAAGLARSFSEIGEGNVLLVDMTQGQGSAQHFHKGSPVGIDQLLDTRGSAFVQGNLYVVSEASSSERLAKGMPQRFNQLIPKLKASDFDYIIFDMPPVNQISITPRLASFMDMMLLVLESEKADRDIALSASALLAKSNAPVAVVLNKAKSYIPAKLHKDREFLLGT